MKWFLGILLALVLIFAVVTVAGNTERIESEVHIDKLEVFLRNLFEEKPFGSLAILDPKSLPEDIMKNDASQCILFKWRDIDGGQVPTDGDWGLICADKKQIHAENCGELASVSIVLKVHLPNAAAAGRGYNARYNLIGFEGRTSGGCKVGETYLTDDFKINGYPAGPMDEIPEDIWDTEACKIIFDRWDDYNGPPVTCGESYYYPETMNQSIGPSTDFVKDGSWIFVRGYGGFSAWPLGHERLTQDHMSFMEQYAPQVLDLARSYSIQDFDNAQIPTPQAEGE